VKVKVLLIDDEASFVDTLGQRLEFRGFAVAKAFSGQEGLEKLKEQLPDVVILDVVMPGQDGVDVLKAIKELEPLTEVMLLTGHADMDSAIQGLKLGAFDYLMKPTETGDLVAKIRKAYARKAEQEERIRRARLDRTVAQDGRWP
jgi:DNA-binding NtrC family response regulator